MTIDRHIFYQLESNMITSKTKFVTFIELYSLAIVITLQEDFYLTSD